MPQKKKKPNHQTLTRLQLKWVIILTPTEPNPKRPNPSFFDVVGSIDL